MYKYVSCLGPADDHHALSLKGEPPDEQSAANPELWRRWIGGPSKKLPQQASHIACLGGRADYSYTLYSIHLLLLAERYADTCGMPTVYCVLLLVQCNTCY